MMKRMLLVNTKITGLNYLKTKGSVFIYNSTVTIICSVFRCIISIVNFLNKNLENYANMENVGIRKKIRFDQEYIEVGCIPSTAVAVSGVGAGVCLPRRVCLPGDVCLQGCLPEGEVAAQWEGVYTTLLCGKNS